jgi:glycine/D-amino acid oxidase-like deaminating enzyme
MLGAWQDLCRNQGVDLIYGLNIEELNVQTGNVKIRQHEFKPGKIVLCTNGLTNGLFKGLDVIPARNQVLITNEILSEPWNCSFHQRQGYVYYRSVGKRILIGGGRDLFKESEYTDSLDINEEIIQYLRGHLEGLIGLNDFQIEHRWSGIMGLGNTKGPIIQKINNQVYVAVRMGGMGVAIGTAVGKQVSEIL